MIIINKIKKNYMSYFLSYFYILNHIMKKMMSISIGKKESLAILKLNLIISK